MYNTDPDSPAHGITRFVLNATGDATMAIWRDVSVISKR